MGFSNAKMGSFAVLKNKMHTLLITGGAGFIGSHLTRLFVTKYPEYKIVNLDALTYAGNLENLTDIENATNYAFVKGNITDLDMLRALFSEHQFTGVLHCAAESHVDRSITDPLAFVTTNVMGTATLLQAAKEYWKDNMDGKVFTIFLLMKCMDLSEIQVFLLKKLLTIQGVLTQQAKHLPIIS